MEVAGRVVSGFSLASAQLAGGSKSSAKTELRNPEQVVGGPHQVGGETGPLYAPIARAPEAADRLDPAEDLLDPLCALVG